MVWDTKNDNTVEITYPRWQTKRELRNVGKSQEKMVTITVNFWRQRTEDLRTNALCTSTFLRTISTNSPLKYSPCTLVPLRHSSNAAYRSLTCWRRKLIFLQPFQLHATWTSCYLGAFEASYPGHKATSSWNGCLVYMQWRANNPISTKGQLLFVCKCNQ